jgi:hypothetical protein
MSARTQQPQGYPPLRLDGPWLKNVEVVVSGPAVTGNRILSKPATIGGAPATDFGGNSVGSIYTPSNYLRVPSTASASPWTIAALVRGGYEALAPLLGMVDDADVNTFDRSIRMHLGFWSGYLYDGGEKYNDAPVAPSASRVDTVILTCDGAGLLCYANGLTNGATSVSNAGYAGYSGSGTGARFSIGRAGTSWHTGFWCGLAVKTQGYWSPALVQAFTADPYGSVFRSRRKVWVLFAPAAGGGTTDAAIAGTQATDVGAVTVEATTGCAVAGTQASDVGAIAVEATTGCAIAGTQTTDVGAVTVEATTGCAVVGTQASDVAAVEVTAGTGSTDASIAGIQTSDVGAIAVEATLGLSLSGTQASDAGYIVVEATLPAAMAGTQTSDVAAITATTTVVVSIWTDVGVSAATWSDVGTATSIWTDL